MKTRLLACVVVLGCGGKKEDKPASPNPAPAAAEVKAGEPSTAAAKPAAPPAAPAAPDTSHGSCRVVVSGAATADQTSGNTGPSVLAVYNWLTQEQRKATGFADEGMILNCLGSDARINILTKKGKAFPAQAGTYAVGRGGEITVMGSVKHPDGELSLGKTEGTFEITAFHDAHIAGKATVTATTMPDKGDVKLDITFDMTKR